MRRIIALIIVLTVLSVPVMAEAAVRANGLILSTSNEDFSGWKWKGDTKATQFRLLSRRAQANQFLRGLPKLARKPIADALADVDFKKDVAIVAYLGGTSGGYDVKIGQLNTNDRSLLVKVGMKSPGKDDMVTMMLTYPFDLVTVPRENVPEGDFEFIVFNQHGDAVMDQWINLDAPSKAADNKTTWHTVRTGDTLWAISRRYGVTINSLMAVNPEVDPDTIWIGQRLRIPTSSVPPVSQAPNRTTYTVRTGDSLWRIGQMYKVTVEQLVKRNNLTGYDLWIGQKLIIPS